MKTIFNETDNKDSVKRIETVQPGNKREWGKMKSGQMMCIEYRDSFTQYTIPPSGSNFTYMDKRKIAGA